MQIFSLRLLFLGLGYKCHSLCCVNGMSIISPRKNSLFSELQLVARTSDHVFSPSISVQYSPLASSRSQNKFEFNSIFGRWSSGSVIIFANSIPIKKTPRWFIYFYLWSREIKGSIRNKEYLVSINWLTSDRWSK